jgi:glycosyltransferase involved in cell wall biosynthesis
LTYARKMDRTKLRVIVPCFNEEAGIGYFFDELRRVLDRLNDCEYEIAFIDDGSTDQTLTLLNSFAQENAAVSVYSFSRNFGHQAALIAGMDTTDKDVDALIMLDSDMQHPPSKIPDMIAAWRSGFEIVSMVRSDTSGQRWFKRKSSAWFYRLMAKSTELKIVSGASDFCLLGRRAIGALHAMPERELFLRGAIAWIGFSRTLINYDAPDRFAGHSKYSLAKMIKLAKQGIFSFSTSPIRICLRMGTALIFVAFMYLIYAVAMFSSNGTVAGWTSLIAVVVFFGGLNLFTLGVLGEYIARTFEEVKARPRYVLKQAPKLMSAKLNSEFEADAISKNLSQFSA